jgi:hypothetical protein
MPIDPLLLELMTQMILIENPALYQTPTASAPLDVYGRHAQADGSSEEWGNAQPYRCRLEFETKIFTDDQGRNRQSSGRAYLSAFHPEVSTESRVTIPSQTQPSLRNPVIMFIDNNYDEYGPYSTTIHFE